MDSTSIGTGSPLLLCGCGSPSSYQGCRVRMRYNIPMEWADGDILRYSRNILIREIGPEGQERISASSVLGVGAGGLGSPALLYLAAAGVGRIGVFARDRVEISNLNRQVIHPERSVGRRKVESAGGGSRGIRPGARREGRATAPTP